MEKLASVFTCPSLNKLSPRLMSAGPANSLAAVGGWNKFAVCFPDYILAIAWDLYSQWHWYCKAFYRVKSSSIPSSSHPPPLHRFPRETDWKWISLESNLPSAQIIRLYSTRDVMTLIHDWRIYISFIYRFIFASHLIPIFRYLCYIPDIMNLPVSILRRNWNGIMKISPF